MSKKTKEIHETNFEFTDVDNRACFSSSMKKWVNKAKKLAEKYPNEVRIAAMNDDGSICINCPSSWFRISPTNKNKVSRPPMTEEQRAAAAERLRIAREKKAEEKRRAMGLVDE